jgi:hypothetical protein
MSTPGGLIYDTNVLISVVPNLKRAVSFLTDSFFKNVVISDTEFVSIDVEIGKRRMSPFVSPLVEGKLVEQLRFQTNTFKPAYIKDKRSPDLRKPVRRMIGERIGGDMTGAEREKANLEFEMSDQVDILTRRIEWMAASALATGTVTVSGDGFPTRVIDFGRDPSLTVALTSTARWTAANVVAGNASPVSNLNAWQHQVLRKSGAKMTDIIFTTSAWEGFLADPMLKGATFYPQLSQSGNFIDPALRIDRGAVSQGRWGQYDLWVYNEWFVDENDVEQPMLADGTVILAGEQLLGTQAFGQILDPAFNYAGLAFAPKTWVSEDPAQRYLMMQSSPMIIPARPNASFSASVCAPVLG